jgi:hypothetical protein
MLRPQSWDIAVRLQSKPGMNDKMLDFGIYCTSTTFECPVLNASRNKNAVSDPNIDRKTYQQM